MTMRKSLILILSLILALSLAGCSGKVGEQTQYQATFLDLFDTVTTIVGKDADEGTFQKKAQSIHDALLEYHQLFDVYNQYEGIHNLKTVNDQAGIAPVTVDRRIIDLLNDCKALWEATDGRVDVTMGSVLALWHDARDAGLDDPAHAALPSEDDLTAAAQHAGFDCLVIDEAASTVFLTDPQARLDVGAVAKGWSAQRVCEDAPTGLLISVGGNVCATGPKDPSGTPWVVGVTDPDDSSRYLHTLYVAGGSVVTSGDYQRYYVVDGVPYHHIIDPDTLYPAAYWRSVTIVCPDSGVADALSTALFVLPLEQGQALLDRFGAHAMWVDAQGEQYYSPGFRDLIRT